ncbi:MAG: TonB-dependent receptor plug domain-containing protein, partial [Bacteroidota bacterium]
VRFFFNGLPLGLAGYPFGIANIPVNLIERAEVYKGVVPIRFGADALGGAINIVAPEGVPGVSGSASYQVGSFGTHRTAADLGYESARTGLFVRGGGFYDFARNDYEVDVFVADNLGRRSEVTVPRFNDRYRSGAVNVSAGVRNRAWANELSVNAYAVDFARQIQNNPTMSGLPFGEAESFGSTYGVNLTYELTLSEQLSFDIVGGYVYSERRLFDVANCRYNWFGECIIETREPGEVIRNRGTDRTTIDDDAFARFNATWRIDEQHILRFSTAPSFNWRTGRDALIVQGTDLLAGNARLTTWVSGLEYQFGKPDGRIENRLFVKDYRRIATSAFGVPLTSGSVLDDAPENRSETNLYGIGNVMRIAWTDRFATKVSYEWATRLPQPDEFFGDGVFVTPNTDLEPERSHNANLELRLTSPINAATSWSLQANGFIRATDNLIRFIAVDEVLNAFDNVVSATSVGFEASGRATLFGERLTLNANTTYQAFRNTSSDGFYSLFEGDRIPNEPYAFANASARYWTRSPLRPGDRLSVFSSTRYVHSFFRTWESAGQRAFASEIPEQITFAAGATYDSTRGRTRWSLTAEVQNLTNATVFDFFGVQRPGRAFFLKLTTQL